VGKNSYETDIKSCNTACRVGMGWFMALLERDVKSMRWFRLMMMPRGGVVSNTYMKSTRNE